MTEKEKLVEKIKNLLALATGENNSDHEKTLAFKRAQELMAKYSISVGFECEMPQQVISRPFVPAGTYRIDNALNGILGNILQAIVPNFGVCVYLNFNRTTPDGQIITGRFVEYFLLGFETNLDLAQYAADTVLYQGYVGFKKMMREHRSISFAPDYWRGFHDGLIDKFQKSSAEGMSLTVYDPIRAKLQEITQGRTTRNWDFAIKSAAYQQGVKDGTDVTIHKGVGGAKRSGNLIG